MRSLRLKLLATQIQYLMDWSFTLRKYLSDYKNTIKSHYMILITVSLNALSSVINLLPCCRDSVRSQYQVWTWHISLIHQNHSIFIVIGKSLQERVFCESMPLLMPRAIAWTRNLLSHQRHVASSATAAACTYVLAENPIFNCSKPWRLPINQPLRYHYWHYILSAVMTLNDNSHTESKNCTSRRQVLKALQTNLSRAHIRSRIAYETFELLERDNRDPCASIDV